MAGFQLFTDLFQRVDQVTTTYVTSMSSAAASAIAPVVGVGLTLTFIAFGMLIIRGAVQMPVSEFLGKSIRIALICGAALGSGMYQGQIANAIQQTPDALASALLPGAEKGQSAAAVIDVAAGSGYEKASEAWENAGIFKEDGLLWGIAGVIIWLATTIFMAVGGAFLLLAKIGLSVLAGLGPIFIASLLWQPTSRFFEAWTGQIVNYTLMVTIFAAAMGLMVDIFGSFVSTMQFDGVQNVAFNLGGLGILSLAMVIALLQLPGIASALGAGASVGFLYEMRALAGGAKAAKGAASAAASAPGKVAGAVGGGVSAARGAAGAMSKVAGKFQGKKAA